MRWPPRPLPHRALAVGLLAAASVAQAPFGLEGIGDRPLAAQRQSLDALRTLPPDTALDWEAIWPAIAPCLRRAELDPLMAAVLTRMGPSARLAQHDVAEALANGGATCLPSVLDYARRAPPIADTVSRRLAVELLSNPCYLTHPMAELFENSRSPDSSALAGFALRNAVMCRIGDGFGEPAAALFARSSVWSNIRLLRRIEEHVGSQPNRAVDQEALAEYDALLALEHGLSQALADAENLAPRRARVVLSLALELAAVPHAIDACSAFLQAHDSEVRRLAALLLARQPQAAQAMDALQRVHPVSWWEREAAFAAAVAAGPAGIEWIRRFEGSDPVQVQSWLEIARGVPQTKETPRLDCQHAEDIDFVLRHVPLTRAAHLALLQNTALLIDGFGVRGQRSASLTRTLASTLDLPDCELVDATIRALIAYDTTCTIYRSVPITSHCFLPHPEPLIQAWTEGNAQVRAIAGFLLRYVGRGPGCRAHLPQPCTDYLEKLATSPIAFPRERALGRRQALERHSAHPPPPPEQHADHPMGPRARAKLVRDLRAALPSAAFNPIDLRRITSLGSDGAFAADWLASGLRGDSRQFLAAGRALVRIGRPDLARRAVRDALRVQSNIQRAALELVPDLPPDAERVEWTLAGAAATNAEDRLWLDALAHDLQAAPETVKTTVIERLGPRLWICGHEPLLSQLGRPAFERALRTPGFPLQASNEDGKRIVRCFPALSWDRQDEVFATDSVMLGVFAALRSSLPQEIVARFARELREGRNTTLCWGAVRLASRDESMADAVCAWLRTKMDARIEVGTEAERLAIGAVRALATAGRATMRTVELLERAARRWPADVPPLLLCDAYLRLGAPGIQRLENLGRQGVPVNRWIWLAMVNPDPEVSTAAIRAASRLGTFAHARPEGIEIPQTLATRFELAASALEGRCPAASALGWAQLALGRIDGKHRLRCLRALQSTEDLPDAVIPLLLECLGAPQAEVRLAATRVLRPFGARAARARVGIEEGLDAEPEGSEVAAALRGLLATF